MADPADRTTRRRAVAALVRRFGVERLSTCENAVQDAFVRALEGAPGGGAREEAWIVRVAHNLAIDALRREARHAPLPADTEVAAAEVPAAPAAIDDELCLVFLCCHPALGRAAQVALTLRVAFGLDTAQIARAFLADERTVAQRIVRAKRQLREARVSFALPEAVELPARLGAILDVLYQLFSEGHATTHGEPAVDAALCAESLRIVRLVTDDPALATPAAAALRALLAFHAARLPARLADDGSLLLLPEQDRGRWDADLVGEGFVWLERAARGPTATRFHLEAGIAACHAAAPRFADTDWERILFLYDQLGRVAPSPVVEVNRALALAMGRGARAGLDELDAIPERELVARYPYALAAYAELHASLGELEAARAYLDRALAVQPSAAEQALLRRKRAALG